MSNTERPFLLLILLIPLSSSPQLLSSSPPLPLVAKGDVPSQVFAQRCEHLILNPPSASGGWDAVHDVLSAPKTIAYPKHQHTMQ